MENQFGKGPENNKVNIMEDIYLFGQFLHSARSAIGKSVVQVASDVGINKDTVAKWEDGASFPEEYKLAVIANSLGISRKKLLEKFRISKPLYDLDKELRKNPKFIPKPSGPDTDVFTGQGRISRRSNHQRRY